MARKGKRRREAARAKRERDRPPGGDEVEATEERPSAPAPSEAKEAVVVSSTRRKKPRRKKRRGGGGLFGTGIPAWVATVPVGGAIAVIVLIFALSGGSSSGEPDPTGDAGNGLTPDESISLNVDDVNFSDTTLSGTAGNVIELVVTNTGTISHNLVVAGADNEYDTDDDFSPDPFAINPGDTGRVVVQIDDPGTYLFRCAFHPDIEFGTITLS